MPAHRPVAPPVLASAEGARASASATGRARGLRLRRALRRIGALAQLPLVAAAEAQAEGPKPYIGGQAVVEGVMMRSPHAYTVAVRRPDGALAVAEQPYTPELTQRYAKVPMLRGLVSLVESLQLGFRALSFSADQQLTDEERAASSGGDSAWLGLFSALFAIGLFLGTPQLLATFLGRYVGVSPESGFAFHALIGVFKLAVFFGYVSLLGATADGKRFFAYHGAEHMTIHAYERELPLDVATVRGMTTLHPRCGTTFLVFVIAFGIVLGSAFAAWLVPDPSGVRGFLAVFALRICLLPLIAGVSFEFQRFTARYCTTGPLRVLLQPGFLFQRITTRVPDDAQLEVAITAMQAAAWRESVGTRAEVSDAPLVFPSFARFEEARTSLRPVTA